MRNEFTIPKQERQPSGLSLSDIKSIVEITPCSDCSNKELCKRNSLICEDYKHYIATGKIVNKNRFMEVNYMAENKQDVKELQEKVELKCWQKLDQFFENATNIESAKISCTVLMVLNKEKQFQLLLKKIK